MSKDTPEVAEAVSPAPGKSPETVTYRLVTRAPRNGKYIVRNQADATDIRVLPVAQYTAKQVLSAKDWNKLNPPPYKR